ncbi:beta-1,4-mannosyltransferase isoform X1 [Zea mays]|nr:beta-1,4-mannosyltransferase isoform X1 [Zea mays]|eukprot:XP_020399251.2 beta-1,4-mannosyltransferase isoform X1 [Zea mays]
MIKNSPGKRSRGSWLGPNNPVLGYRCSGSFSPRVRSLCLRRLGYAAAAVLRLVPRSSLDPSPATSVRQVPGFPARTISLPFLMLKAMATERRRASVVVLGDIGRSPRMQYHSLSLANQASMEVDIVANGGSDPHLSLRENPSIHIHEMKTVQLTGISKISGALSLLLKAAVQFILLVWFLCFKIPRPDVFFVQNPPSVPTLAAVKLASWLRGAKFIVDWHNFGYTLLGLSHGRSHIIVKIYFWFEKYFGQMADGAFCVTKAMQHELAQNWGIRATVLYDQSPDFFHPASLMEKHGLFSRLGNSMCSAMGNADCISVEEVGEDMNTTAFTSKIDGQVFLKPNRPALVVSSTSWTPDEDFSILLEAALMYDRRVAAALGEDDSMDEGQLWIDIKNGKQFVYPRLLFIITGKGPDRKKYEDQIKRLKLRRVALRTMWLASEDYPLLLGSADLGVSLHTSSSGLDLPMKVVDMFGCGLPVCAASFSCIEELVKVNKNGLLFSTSSELADELMMLFKGFPEECNALKSLKEGAMKSASSSKWSTEWETNALPLVDQVIG